VLCSIVHLCRFGAMECHGLTLRLLKLTGFHLHRWPQETVGPVDFFGLCYAPKSCGTCKGKFPSNPFPLLHTTLENPRTPGEALDPFILGPHTGGKWWYYLI
jgi:hypothetical protein